MKTLKLFLFILLSSFSSLLLASNTPAITLAPATLSAVEGSTSVYLTITADSCPDTRPISIQYSALYDAGATIIDTGSITFDAVTTCQKSQEIQVTGMGALNRNETVTITISDNGTQSQQTFTIANNKAVLTILEPPSNTPTISISPITKNISIGTTDVNLSVEISECPNKETIDVNWTNDANASNFGQVDFNVTTCTKSKIFTVKVPTNLTVGSDFNVTIDANSTGTQNIGPVNPSYATISILKTVSDVSIKKDTNSSKIYVNTAFEYIMAIYNGGESNATGVKIIDEIPYGVDVNLTTTNSANSDWNCTLVDRTLTCVDSLALPKGSTRSLVVKATAASYGGDFTNSVTVYSDNDSDILNNTASTTTTFINTGSADDMCYSNSTGTGGKCLQIGSSDFFISETGNNNECDSSASLINKQSIHSLTGVTVKKLYRPAITSGSCSTDSGTCSGPVAGGETDYSDYTMGYIYSPSDMATDSNFTMEDEDTFNLTTGDVNDSIIYGTYTKDGDVYSGQVFRCSSGSGSSDSNATGDVIDTSITTNANTVLYNALNDTGSVTGNPGSNSLKFIRTKVAGESVPLTAVYLNDANQSVDYDNNGQDPDKALWFLIPVLNDISVTGGCPAGVSSQLQQLIDPNTGLQAVMKIADNGSSDYSDTLNVIMPTTATKEAKIEFIVVDSSLLDDDAQNCVAVSSTSGNLEGLGQCVNSRGQYVDAYGEDSASRCIDNTASGQPCLSSNGGSGTGLFAGDLGCLMCTFYTGTACSRDDFAIRPENFELNSTNPHMPDLLRSGSDYDFTLNAFNAKDVISTDVNTLNYNQTKANMGVNESNVTAKDGSATVLSGVVTFASTDFNMSNGVSLYGGANEVVGIKFSDVGKVNVKVTDKNWAAIDVDDTPESCDADGTWICGEKNVTFIPHHFEIKDINMTNVDGLPGNYTYIANLDDANQSTFNMAAKIQTTVVAQNESNVTTVNFQDGAAYYENPVMVDSNVTHSFHGEANTTTVAAALLGFSGGEKQLAWDDTNLSAVLRFNFLRETNTSVNPFVVTAADMNLSTSSIYTQTAVTGYDATADINGSEAGFGDGNATMIYGRTNGPRQRFTGNSGTAFIYHEAFCYGTDSKGISCSKALLPNGVASRTTNDPRWFTNTLHTTPYGIVGTITQKGAASLVTNSAGVTADTLGVATVPLVYSGTTFPYKATMENNASAWLIYNKYDINDVNNEFEVEFGDSNSSWAGQHETDTNTRKSASDKTNRRSMW